MSSQEMASTSGSGIHSDNGGSGGIAISLQ
jgi:hypothetical protein